jgi:mono/diheme cytochrome c family protein
VRAWATRVRRRPAETRPQAEQVFADNRSGCHGVNGTGANGGPTLARQNDRQAVMEQVRNGGGGMPAFDGALSDQEIQDVAVYVTEEIAQP